MSTIEICNYVPGAIGRITELHANYYSKNWGFGLYFESKVAIEMSEFLNRFHSERDGFWVAVIDGKVVGSIAIDGIKSETEGAHLRWFIVAPEYLGTGIGNALIKRAIEFCRIANFNKVYLWTFAGLDAARHLYEKEGFRLSEEFEGDQWGVKVIEQKFVLTI